MNQQEIENEKDYLTVEIIEYVTNSVVSKTILKKISGNVSVLSVDAGEELAPRTIPFDSFVQVIDGKVDLVVNDKVHSLQTGHSMIVPAHATSYVKPDGRFKMIITVIKSGYE